MSVINDMAEKMKSWHEPPTIYADAEKLHCSRCGKEYVSRGKFDPGICRDCEKEETRKNAYCIGGPLDGEKAYDEG